MSWAWGPVGGEKSEQLDMHVGPFFKKISTNVIISIATGKEMTV